MTYNFCAGPAALPQKVMQRAQAELLDWNGTGISVMEISHRTQMYQDCTDRAERNLRKLLNIGESHAVLFLHGGASHQFSNIPMSLLSSGAQAEYITNGIWSDMAYNEAVRFGNIHHVKALQINDVSGLRTLKEPETWDRCEKPVYTHYTPNETIEGIKFNHMPQTNGALIADMSSCILAESINVNDFDMIYAGAQKNIGPAGMTIVIIKRELYERMNFDTLPKLFNYEQQDKKGSMINTPPTFAWYLAGLVFEWLLEEGGVAKMEALSIQKSSLLYNCIDEDDFYVNLINPKDRSLMNVSFRLKDDNLNNTFLSEAKEAKLVGLEGHRSIGGMRASIYNSMPIEGVQQLEAFMRKFKSKYG